MNNVPALVPADGRNESGQARFRRRLLFVILIVGGLIYGGFMRSRVGACAAGSDASGYLNTARMLKFGHVAVPQRQLGSGLADDAHSMLFTPLGFHPVDQDRMTGTYPIGLPLLLAATAPLTGWREAGNWAMWAHALAGLALIYCLARQCRLSPAWAALGVLLIATSPLYIEFSLELMSDVPATVWALAAMVCALYGRENARWAVAAGFATGIAVLVRPTNLLIALPAVLAIGWGPRRLLAYLAGGAPVAIVNLAYNAAAYGTPFANGYSGFGALDGAFSLSYVGPTLAHYAHWLPILLTPAGVLALAIPIRLKPDARLVLVLTAWMLVYAAFYATYTCTHETWWYLRFVLPAFPAAWIAALWVMRDLLGKAGFAKFAPSGSWMAWGLGTATAIAIYSYNLHWNRELKTFETGMRARVYADASAWLKTKVPAKTPIVAMQMSGALFYDTDFPIVRWDSIDSANFSKLVAAAQRQDRPLVALLQPWERERIVAQKHLAGRWTRVESFADWELWKYEGGLDEPARLRESY